MSITNKAGATAPRSVAEIEKQLADLAKVKQRAEEYGVRDAASRIALDSLQMHEDELRAELEVARDLMHDSGGVANDSKSSP